MRSYTRLTWHGYPSDFEVFLDLTPLETVILVESFDELIEQSNEGDGTRPKDSR